MSATVSLTASSESAGSSLRFLGIMGLLGAPGMLIDASIRYAVHDTGEGLLASSSVVGLVYIIGWMASMIGFRRLRLTGDGRFAQVVFLAQIMGLLLAAGQQIMELIATPTLLRSVLFGICDTAWPVSHLLMLVVGGMVLAARRVRGLARFAPLGCGLALPATALLAKLNHYVFVFGFGLATMLCFSVVALTVYRAGVAKEI